MKLAFGIVFLWLAVACFYIAFRQGTAVTPWQVIQEIVSGATGQGGPQAPEAGVPGAFVAVPGGDTATGATGGTAAPTGGTAAPVPGGGTAAPLSRLGIGERSGGVNL